MTRRRADGSRADAGCTLTPLAALSADVVASRSAVNSRAEPAQHSPRYTPARTADALEAPTHRPDEARNRVVVCASLCLIGRGRGCAVCVHGTGSKAVVTGARAAELVAKSLISSPVLALIVRSASASSDEAMA